MLELDAVPLNLDVTLCCGQVFRWSKVGDWWVGVARDRAFKIRKVCSKFEFCNVDEKFVVHYFGLDENLQHISEIVNKDAHIGRALKRFWGLRIIRQDPWECLISYICATYKSIPAIKHMLNNLTRIFGKRIVLDGCDYFGFPSPEKLACASARDLLECGLGYRAKYVLETSKRICDGEVDFEKLRSLPYAKAKKALMGLPGVGAKVADCILLFSLGKLEAFPVDVWVKRVVLNHYADKLPKELVQKLRLRDGLSSGDYERLNRFGRSYFGEYAGYAQEYLYHYERMQR
jgi:N-glycosylase/DNA lyase